MKAVKPLSTATTSATISRAPKKIDMGAAFNYGKSSDLGINSPTHRNTHSENLFGDDPVAPKASTSKSNNDIIEDIFSSAASTSDPIDDFDPRAGEPSADFGDFSAAFGASKAPAAAPVASEFADFSSAFSSSQPVAPTIPIAASVLAPTQSLHLDDNFLFSSQPAPAQSPNSLLDGADLFGNSVITSAFTSPKGGNNKDLLSDFGDLALNPIQGEHNLLNVRNV